MKVCSGIADARVERPGRGAGIGAARALGPEGRLRARGNKDLVSETRRESPAVGPARVDATLPENVRRIMGCDFAPTEQSARVSRWREPRLFGPWPTSRTTGCRVSGTSWLP